MPPTAACTMLTLTSSVESSRERVRQAFVRALHVGLDDERERLRLALAHLLEDVLELRRLLLRELDVAELALPEERDLARLALVAEHDHIGARGGHVREARGSPPGSTAPPRRSACRSRRASRARARTPRRRAQCRPASASRTGPARSRPGRAPCRAAIRSRSPWPARRAAPSAPAPPPAAAGARAARRCPCRSWPKPPRTWCRRPTPPARRPALERSCFTRSGFASGLSILLSATTIGTFAALAWWIASVVCGITPSSAATTSTTMSVSLAPRARIAVNASWPGVSRNVIMPRGVST